MRARSENLGILLRETLGISRISEISHTLVAFRNVEASPEILDIGSPHILQTHFPQGV